MNPKKLLELQVNRKCITPTIKRLLKLFKHNKQCTTMRKDKKFQLHLKVSLKPNLKRNKNKCSMKIKQNLGKLTYKTSLNSCINQQNILGKSRVILIFLNQTFLNINRKQPFLHHKLRKLRTLNLTSPQKVLLD